MPEVESPSAAALPFCAAAASVSTASGRCSPAKVLQVLKALRDLSGLDGERG